MDKAEQDFIEATARWYDHVGKDHHKDRDCHWYLTRNTLYSYGQPPVDSGWSVRHNGYILDDEEFWGATKELALESATEFINETLKERQPPPL